MSAFTDLRAMAIHLADKVQRLIRRQFVSQQEPADGQGNSLDGPAFRVCVGIIDKLCALSGNGHIETGESAPLGGVRIRADKGINPDVFAVVAPDCGKPEGDGFRPGWLGQRDEQNVQQAADDQAGGQAFEKPPHEDLLLFSCGAKGHKTIPVPSA